MSGDLSTNNHFVTLGHQTHHPDFKSHSLFFFFTIHTPLEEKQYMRNLNSFVWPDPGSNQRREHFKIPYTVEVASLSMKCNTLFYVSPVKLMFWQSNRRFTSTTLQIPNWILSAIAILIMIYISHITDMHCSI